MSTFLSTTGHLESCGNLGGPSSKAKYYPVTDSEQVPRGKGEKKPSEGNEKILKPCIYKQSNRYELRKEISGTAYLLHHESASYACVALG